MPSSSTPQSKTTVLESSTLVTRARDTLTTTKHALKASRAGTAVHTLLDRLTHTVDQLATWSTTSRLHQLSDQFGTTTETATTTTIANTVAHWAASSRLYRWLTEEPDPDVIVIDLRDTYAIGPFITVLDRIIDTLTPYYVTATLKRITDTAAHLAAQAANTRVGHLIIAVLEPPAPPEASENTRDSNE